MGGDDTLSSPLWLSLLGTVLALTVVLALAYLVLRGAQKWSQRHPAKGAMSPRVLRSIGLGGRERLVVVQHHDVELLLGVTANGVTVLERRRVDADEAHQPAAPANDQT